jgi:hypothetical protein
MKTIAFLAAALLSCAALAQTSTVTPREDRGYQPMRGTSNVGKPVATEAACEAAIAADVLVRKATSLYKCRHETVKLGAYSAAPAPVVCPVPPAPTVATVACASPLVGTWQQTTTVSIGPAPTCTRTVALTPATAPAGACGQAPAGAVVYVSPTGNDSNPGTQAAPRRSLTGAWLTGLAAGTTVRVQRGGTWGNVGQVNNYNVTPTAPLVIEPYGTGAAPVTGFYEFACYQCTRTHGGYVLRGIDIVGSGSGSGIAYAGATTHLTLDGVTVRGWSIGILMGDGARNFTLRNSTVRDNVQHGMLGAGYDWLVEGNTFQNNGDARPPGTHAIYFSAGSLVAERITIRGNTFRNNSQQGGVCRAGNITAHGRIVGLTVEGNDIESTTGFGGGCRAISLVAGYGSQEYVRQGVVRNNLRGVQRCTGYLDQWQHLHRHHEQRVSADRAGGKHHWRQRRCRHRGSDPRQLGVLARCTGHQRARCCNRGRE